jgi:hypothetical protein
MSIEQRYWLDPRQDAALLTEVLQYFKGDAAILLEGDLSHFHFEDIAGNSAVVAQPFNREAPEANDAIILPLEESTVDEILRRIIPANKFKKRIKAIQVVKGGAIQFMAGDNFHRECVSIHSDTPLEFLEHLRSEFIIKRFTADGCHLTRRSR